MKVVNEENQMIREINEEDGGPIAVVEESRTNAEEIIHNVGDVLANEPLNSAA